MSELLDTVDAPPEVTGDLMTPPSDGMIVESEYQRAIALVEARRDCPQWQAVNQWEKMAAELPQQLCPLDHVFTPGLYTRVIFMPAGTKLTSKIHLFEHPYIIAAGTVSVWTFESGWHTIRAPFVGVTMPATRRVLYIHEDTIWITSHVNPSNEKDPDKIVSAITYDHMRLGHMDAVSPEKMASILDNQKGKLT